jgi:iron-sulfur cluster assembly accessory protein
MSSTIFFSIKSNTYRKINSVKESQMLRITESAKEYLSIMTEHKRRNYVRLSVSGGGCSGFQYNWDYVDTDKDGTLIEELLVLDKLAEMFVLGCTVDYVQELGGSYLKVMNPNAKASCGCGESFAV